MKEIYDAGYFCIYDTGYLHTSKVGIISKNPDSSVRISFFFIAQDSNK